MRSAAIPKSRLESLLRNPEAAAIVAGVQNGKYPSQSEADLALANHAVGVNFTLDQFQTICEKARANSGASSKPPVYFDRTFAKAGGIVSNGTQRPTSNGSAKVSGNPTETLQTETSVGSVGCRVGRVEPFPVEVLPEVLGKFVRDAAKAITCPEDYIGTFALGAVSACIGRRRSIQISPSWTESACLYVCVVARSGDRKTPAFDAAVAPLCAIQSRLAIEHKEDEDAYRNLSAEDKEQRPKPQLKQIITTDSTIEALKDVLSTNPFGVGYLDDELTGFVKSLGQYKNGGGDDRQHWLKIWSGVQLIVNRKTSGTLIIDEPFVSLVGGIQPSRLGSLMHDAEEDGLPARFLPSFPDPIPRGKFSEAGIPSEGKYKQLCDTLWKMTYSDAPLKFSMTAKRAWVEWYNERQEPADNLRPFWSKCDGYCARLALILHLVGQTQKPNRTDIEKCSVEGAIKLIDYFLSHAKKSYASVATYGDGSRDGRALQWIQRKGGKVTARDVQQSGLCGCKNAEEAKELLQYLEDGGYGTAEEKAHGSFEFTLLTLHPTHPTEADDAEGSKS